MTTIAKGIGIGMILAAAAGAARAQVVINEVFENPPGSTDSAWEYIELYGVPGTDLTGMAIALLKGGVDDDGDNIPGPIPPLEDVDPGAEYAEIDEAFQLDGIIIPANGMVVIYRGGGALNLMNNTPGAAQTVKVSTASRHIPSSDEPGQLANDASSSYVLVRKRAFHSVNVNNVSVYELGYAWRKDVSHDVNFNGKIDCGNETIVLGSNPGFGPTTIETGLEPYQMVDDVAWSHLGGKEYVRSSEQEISDSPGFNPDAICRIRYFGRNPLLGARFNSDNVLRPSRTADEEWIHGDILTVSTGPDQLRFEDGRVKGPTDPNGPFYDGSCNPDTDPGCLPVPDGVFQFADLSNLNQFRLTPGILNDNAALGITQFRFISGDLNFDSKVDVEDLYAAHAKLGATIDDTEPFVNDNGTPDDPSDDCSYIHWKWEGRNFNAILAMTKLNTADGAGGSNSPAVTTNDITAGRALVRANELVDVNAAR